MPCWHIDGSTTPGSQKNLYARKCGMQAVLLQAVKDNAAGQPQFSIALYVAAPMDADITDNWQILHVVDQRTLPGEDASFPLVRKRKEKQNPLPPPCRTTDFACSMIRGSVVGDPSCTKAHQPADAELQSGWRDCMLVRTKCL